MRNYYLHRRINMSRNVSSRNIERKSEDKDFEINMCILKTTSMLVLRFCVVHVY